MTWIYLSSVLTLLNGQVGGDAQVDLDVCLAQYQENRKACGPIAAWYCLRSRGHDVSPSDIRAQLVLGEQGVGIATLLEVVRRYEPQAEVVECRANRIELLPTPSILVINNSHCVTFVSLDRSKALARVFDPAVCQLRDIELGTLRTNWSRQAIVFSQPMTSLSAILALASVSAIAVACAGQWVLKRFCKRRPVK